MIAVSLADALDRIADHLGWLGEVPPLMDGLPWDGVSKPKPQIHFNWVLEYDHSFPAAIAEECRQEIAYLKGPELASEFQTRIDIVHELRRWDRRRRDWEREPHEPDELYSDLSTLGFELQDEIVDIQEQALHGERFVRRLAKNIRTDHGPQLNWNAPGGLSNDAKELWRSLGIKLLGERGNVFRLPYGELETEAQIDAALIELMDRGLVEAESIEGTHKRLFRVKPPVAAASLIPEARGNTPAARRRVPKTRRDRVKELEPIVLHLDAQQIFVDGVYYDLTATATEIMDTLVKAQGAWVGGKSLKNSRGSRPDMIIAKMPEQVRELIETSTQNGYRVLRARP